MAKMKRSMAYLFQGQKNRGAVRSISHHLMSIKLKDLADLEV